MSEKYSVKQNGSGGMSGAVPTPANSHVGHDKPKAFDAEGTIGKQFTGKSQPPQAFSFLFFSSSSSSSSLLLANETLEEDGALGGVAQKIGGPLDKDGAIGKQFTTEGSIGGAVQEKLGGVAHKSN